MNDVIPKSRGLPDLAFDTHLEQKGVRSILLGYLSMFIWERFKAELTTLGTAELVRMLLVKEVETQIQLGLTSCLP